MHRQIHKGDHVLLWKSSLGKAGILGISPFLVFPSVLWAFLGGSFALAGLVWVPAFVLDLAKTQGLSIESVTGLKNWGVFGGKSTGCGHPKGFFLLLVKNT